MDSVHQPTRVAMGRSTRRTAVVVQDEEPVLSGTEQNAEPRDKEELRREVWDEFQREHYEAVEMLPLQLRRQSSLIRELDEQGRAELKKVVDLVLRYKRLRERLASGEPALESEATPSDGPNDTRSLLTSIGQSLSEYVRTSEEKVSIASNAYDSVDRHVRAMDVMIQEQEATLALGSRTIVFGYHQGTQSAAAGQQNGGSKGSSADPMQVDSTSVKIDMPVDPNEPIYCTCRNVSYGGMVGCDDDDCPYEWFHLACVGLTSVPKSKAWFCDHCKSKREQARKRK